MNLDTELLGQVVVLTSKSKEPFNQTLTQLRMVQQSLVLNDLPKKSVKFRVSGESGTIVLYGETSYFFWMQYMGDEDANLTFADSNNFDKFQVGDD